PFLPAEPVAIVLELADVSEILEVADVHRPAAHAVVGKIECDQELDEPVVVAAQARVGVSPEAGGEPPVKVDAVLDFPPAGDALLLKTSDARQRPADVIPRRTGEVARQILRPLNERVTQAV